MNIFLTELNKEVLEKQSNLKTHKENRIYEIDFTGKHLSENLILFNESGDSKTISQIISGDMLIFRYSELNCGICIEEQINNLNQCPESMKNKILLFTTYETHEYMLRFKRANKISFPIFNLSKKSNNELEDIGLPYLFVLSECNMRINNMFVPLKEIPQLTEFYLKEIEKKYFTP